MEKPSSSLRPPQPPSDSPIPPAENIPASAARREADRGREADSPAELPKNGWLDVLWRTRRQLNADNLGIVAAGVAFYAFVASVPALAFLIAIYALMADASTLSRHLDLLARVIPAEVMPLLQDQMTRIVKNNTAAGISAVIGALLALYSSANATKALITGLNVAYNEREKRGFFKLNLLALALTFGALIVALFSIGLVAAAPSFLRQLGLNNTGAVLSWLRWPGVLLFFTLAVAALYRFAPSRHSAQWKWLSPGAFTAAILWLAGSLLFSLYVAKFGSYQKTYGSLGAVVVFLLWLYLSAYAVLLGAELNSEMERQTEQDTTKGAPKRLGNRGAFAADTVGPSRGSGGPGTEAGSGS